MSDFSEPDDSFEHGGPGGIDPKHLSPSRYDPAELHALVDDLATALHGYVDVAAGIRAEFDAATAQDDPRIEAVEDRLGQINAEISRRFEEDLGILSGHTAEVWVDLDDDETEDDDLTDGAVYEMGFIVAPRADAEYEDAFNLIESGGERIVRDLFEAGFEVQEWGTSRSDLQAGGFEDEDSTDPDDLDGPGDSSDTRNGT